MIWLIILISTPSNQDADKIESVLNKEMKKVGECCDVNKLILNLKRGKTESMLFGTKKRLKSHGRNLIVSFNDSKINFVNSYVLETEDSTFVNIRWPAKEILHSYTDPSVFFIWPRKVSDEKQWSEYHSTWNSHQNCLFVKKYIEKKQTVPILITLSTWFTTKIQTPGTMVIWLEYELWNWNCRDKAFTSVPAIILIVFL